MDNLTQQQGTLHTPDGRYIVVDGVLWRATNPALSLQKRSALVSELMAARRAVRAAASDTEALRIARQRVHAAKLQLGERGPVWWDDGQPGWTRNKVLHSPYGALNRQRVPASPSHNAPHDLRT